MINRKFSKLGIVCCLFFGYGCQIFAQNPLSTKGLQNPGLKGGMAQANITPPVGCRLAGHFYESISTGIHDSLWAKAMVLQQGNNKFVFIFCDLIGLTREISTSARSKISAITGVPFSHILVAATHSHTGPLFYGFQHAYFHNKALKTGIDPHEKTDYVQFLINQIVKSAVDANHKLSQIKIEVGVTREEGLSYNRRYYMKNGEVIFNPGPLNPDIVRPAGPTDPELGIVMLRNTKSEKFQGGVSLFAMHADTFGGTEISADYPYYLEQVLKTELGSEFISAFALGACGDLNHINTKVDEPIYSPDNSSRIGQKLGNAVLNKLTKLRPIQQPSLKMMVAKIELPLQVPTKDQIDTARKIINNLYQANASGEYMKRAGGESGDFLKRVEMSKYLNLAKQNKTVSVEVQVFRIDAETAIVGLPGELFSELGLAIKKQSPFKNTFVMTVCNDKTSYIPTRKAFTEGSYEVTNAIVKAGAGEKLVETAGRLLKEIKTNQ